MTAAGKHRDPGGGHVTFDPLTELLCPRDQPIAGETEPSLQTHVPSLGDTVFALKAGLALGDP